MKSYSARGGVQSPAFVGKLGDQLKRENNVFDFAKQQGGGARVVVDGWTLGGDKVRDLELDPALFRGSTVTPYFDIAN